MKRAALFMLALAGCTHAADVELTDAGCVATDPCMVGVCEVLVPDNYVDCECVAVPSDAGTCDGGFGWPPFGGGDGGAP